MVGRDKTPSPATTQKNSILNYFARAPKPDASPLLLSSPGPGTSSSSSPAQPCTSSYYKTPTGTTTVTAGRRIPSGALNEYSKTSESKKRGIAQEISPTAESPSESKRVKIETLQISAGFKEFTEGSLVWAKLEGYPFWPGMLRGERLGQSISRKNNTEYHVQFFDENPSRAWIRKGDMKPYLGSTDMKSTAAIVPARSDKNWVKSCKTADTAVQLSPSKRIEKYWVTFSENEDEEDEGIDEKRSPKKTKSSDSERTTPSVVTPSSKRKRLHHRVRPIIESSDEEDTKKGRVKSKNKSESDHDDYVPLESEESKMESEKENSIGTSSDEEESGEESDSDVIVEEAATPRSSKKRKPSSKNGLSKTTSTSNNKTPVTPITNKNSTDFKNRLLQYSNVEDSPSPGSPGPSVKNKSTVNGTALDTNGTDGTKVTGNWPHLKAGFLQPKVILDKNKKAPSDPGYNPRSVHVPMAFLDSLTPAMRQWWQMKSDNFDTILFFKLGKFYELYNMDAVTAVEELGLIFMRGEYAHCGFPEIGYARYSSILIQNGHKVARIEQTETPDMMVERCRTSKTKVTKFDKVVRREICQISTKGVRLASIQDDSNNPFLPGSEYLYAITEKVQFNAQSEYGVCFIDTSIGTFYIGQFTDDRNCSRLRTLFSHYVPVQILHEKNRISASLQELFLNTGSGVRKEALSPESEFWSGAKLLKFLAEGSYFSKDGESFDSALDWPDNLQNLLCKNDSLGLTPDSSWTLGVSCVGAIVWYLKQCLVEHDILSLKQFEIYIPVDSIKNSVGVGGLNKSLESQSNGEHCIPKNKFQVLDGITLRNLGIIDVPNSLLSVLDKCYTNFGKRLLRHWVCSPLAVPKEISERLNTVEDFLNNPDICESVVPLLKLIQKVDLERLLIKVHTLGSKHRSSDHPDSRAFMFDDKIYSKRRIENLTLILRNFKLCSQIHQELQSANDGRLKSKIALRLISDYPDLTELFDYFDNAFDHKLATTAGKIIPADGVDQEYDEAKQAIREIEVEAAEYLREVHSQLNARVTYFGTEKRRFQIEVPEKVRVGNKFEISSNRKGFKRYVTSETKELLARTLQAEVTRDNVLKDISRRIFEQFDKHREKWSKAVSTISTLDVLISLSVYSNSENMTRPNVIYSTEPFLQIENGRHPCISQDAYIPNDTTLGSDSKGNFVLLTGPNMGGKSTLMRQIGLIATLAHMGCYVPASKCEISVVDRIFTRLGANDNIGEGESTFFVELSETSSILRHSTPHSLVLMDELGRGTATYDGTSIAYAVACKLAERCCRTIFSTHYHALVESIQDLPSVQLGHMACMVENENDDDPTQETITFLYKLAPGPCPKSYGFNAAKLAGISQDIIRVAYKKAKELEESVRKVERFRSICSDISSNLCSLVKAVDLH